MTAHIRSLTALSLLALAVALAGCGGKGSDLGGTFSSAAFTVLWSSSKSDPLAESAKIVLMQGGSQIATQTVDRYQNEVQTTVNFDRLPPGPATASVTVYPMAGGGGTATGQASLPMPLTGGGDFSITLTTLTTGVDRVVMSPDTAEIAVNDTIQLTATPYDSDKQVVLVPVGAIHWTSSKTTVASVDATGLVVGLIPGKSNITATEVGTTKCASIPIPVGYAQWTVLAYMAADSNLEEYALMDMNEMESIGSDSKVKVVVQLDRTPGYDDSNGNWTTTRRYYVTKDEDAAIINSQLVQDLGEVDMAAPESLASFIQWGMEKYPADHYLLVMWDHGRGWRSKTLTGMLPREVRSINIDVTSNSEMSLAALRQALEMCPDANFDIVCFDACLMQMMEVAYSIKDHAAIMAGSEENVPVLGQPYGRVLARITANPQITPYALSEGIVDEYMDYFGTGYAGTFEFSAVNLTSLDLLVTKTDELAQSILDNLATAQAGVRLAQAQAQHFDYDDNVYSNYKDLYDFARLVNDQVAVPAVQSKAQAVMSAIDNVMIHERNSGDEIENAHGLSIYLPDPGTALSQYNSIDFSLDTHWDEMITAY